MQNIAKVLTNFTFPLTFHDPWRWQKHYCDKQIFIRWISFLYNPLWLKRKTYVLCFRQKKLTNKDERDLRSFSSKIWVQSYSISACALQFTFFSSEHFHKFSNFNSRKTEYEITQKKTNQSQKKTFDDAHYT